MRIHGRVGYDRESGAVDRRLQRRMVVKNAPECLEIRDVILVENSARCESPVSNRK